MKHRKLSRRGFLRSTFAGAAGVSAVGAAAAQTDKGDKADEPKAPPKYSDYLKDLDKCNGPLPLTENNIEGPFYRPGAPWIQKGGKLHEEGDMGDVLIISGTVLNRQGQPIPEAWLEVWHSSTFGHYDNEDPDNPPPNKKFRLRGRIPTDKQGEFAFETIRPGHYKIGPTQHRTAHMHVKVHAPGHQSLTTQFFFKGEKYNKTDPWFKPSMVFDLKPEGEKFRATIELVLEKA
jgi:protocatechuate 3,4-dioxygenase beta subunit